MRAVDCLEFTEAMEHALGVVEQCQRTEDYDKEPEPVYVQETERTRL